MSPSAARTLGRDPRYWSIGAIGLTPMRCFCEAQQMSERRTAGTPIRFRPEELAAITENAHVLRGLPPWLGAFVREAMQETGTLRDNGAEQAAVARSALLKKLLATASAWLDVELGTREAARETGRCDETIRRAVRAGTVPDRRASPHGRHKIRRGDLQKLAAPEARPYDPSADAQDIARLRRKV